MSAAFSSETFFASQAAPTNLQQVLEDLTEFVKLHAAQDRRIVLVTSGGTTVPLEHNVVRFLDNFSAGTRGAASAEHFLRTGRYAVIFMHRQHSLQPFSRHYSHSTHPFLDLIDMDAGSTPSLPTQGPLFPPLTGVSHPTQASTVASPSKDTPPLHIHEPNLTPMISLLRSYKLVKRLNLLHTITFVTIQDYLFFLRGVSQVLAEHAGRKSMYYLAAAVSDFFIPQQKMSEHKIQSGKGSLVIEMDLVPKILRPLVKEWSNEGFIVSFKLETDEALLIPKSGQALERYGHQLVIGNTLHTRKFEVVFVQPGGGEEWIRISKQDAERGHEIESDIVSRLVARHTAWIESQKA